MKKQPSDRTERKDWTLTDLAVVSVAFLFLTGFVLPLPFLWVIAALISFVLVLKFGVRLLYRLNSTIKQQM